LVRGKRLRIAEFDQDIGRGRAMIARLGQASYETRLEEMPAE
jgi:hypothetical protein